MPEKHLFVNYSHYQDRPDPGLRQRIASHAARYGPNGSLAFKTVPDQTQDQPSRSASVSANRHSPPSSAMRRSSSTASTMGDAILRQDFETMLARFDECCACSDATQSSGRHGKSNTVHMDDCCLLDDYLDLCAQAELPLRVPVSTDLPTIGPNQSLVDDGLITQCLLVTSQAGVDVVDPKFNGKPSKQTLALQQKALAAMQQLIKARPNIVEDSLLLGAATLMSIAALFDDSDAYKAHKSSLQKLIDAQGGMNQTRIHRIVRATSEAGEVCLALNRYMSTPRAQTASKKDAAPQFPPHAPLKLKYPMPPFSTETVKAIERLASGFQALAKASKLSMQAIQVVGLCTNWSSLIDQPVGGDADLKQLLGESAGATSRLLDLYTQAINTQRMAALLLVSLPTDGAQMKLERCLVLGFLNILHSLSSWHYPQPQRDRLINDFNETMFTLTPKDKEEEDCLIWLVLSVATEWRHCAAKLRESPLLERHGHDATSVCQIWVQRSKQIMDWLVLKLDRARSFEEIAKACARFLWLRRMHGEWKLTWKEAMERRMKNMPRKKVRS